LLLKNREIFLKILHVLPFETWWEYWARDKKEAVSWIKFCVTNHSSRTSNNPWAIYPLEQRSCARYPSGQISSPHSGFDRTLKTMVRGISSMYICICVYVYEEKGREGNTANYSYSTRSVRHSACKYNGMLSDHLKFKCCVLNAL